MKALHPADPEIKTTRVPGGINNSAALCWDSVVTIDNGDGDDLTIDVIPSLFCPAVLKAFKEGVNPVVPIYNSVLASTLTNKVWNSATDWNLLRLSQGTMYIIPKLEKYRITSQSVTAELIAPALSDQGTVTAFQYERGEYRQHLITAHDVPSLASTEGFGEIQIVGEKQFSSKPITLRDPVPSENTALNFTRAFTGLAKNGVYMPLRLTNFDWHDLQKEMVFYDGQLVELSGDAAGFDTNTLEAPPTINFQHNTKPCSYDIYGASTAGFIDYVRQTTGDHETPSDTRYNGYLGTFQNNFGRIYFKGMARGTSIRLRVRQTFELIVDQSSPYASLVDVPPAPDSTALKMYREVSNRMKDAYPASYNDLEKLKGVVKSIANAILPMVKPALALTSRFTGPIGGAVNLLAQPLIDAGIGWAKDAPIQVGPGLVKSVLSGNASKEAAAKAKAEVNAANQLLAQAYATGLGQAKKKARRKRRKQIAKAQAASATVQKALQIVAAASKK